MMEKFNIDPDQFDLAYGKGAMDITMRVMNALAPLTRRDEYWSSNGPFDAVAEVLKRCGCFKE